MALAVALPIASTDVMSNPSGADVDPPEVPTEPTLRYGDQSVDNWVEYLQESLNFQFGQRLLETDGVFGPRTHDVVLRFQHREGLMADGTVGNQTWAALRGATPQPPSTDGREPHTFVEHGAQARWFKESRDILAYDANLDIVFLTLVLVGDVPLPTTATATVRISGADGQVQVFEPEIGSPVGDHPPMHFVQVADLKATFGVGSHRVEGSLPPELGGDTYDDHIVVS
jgi:hypothetical protein